MSEFAGRPNILSPRFEPLLVRSALARVLLFTIAYAIWQPAAQLFLHWVVRKPLPFSGTEEWVRFEVAVVVLGAVACAAFDYGSRARSQRRGDLLKDLTGMIAFTTMLVPSINPGLLISWFGAALMVLLVLITAPVITAMWAIPATIVRRSLRSWST